MSELARTANAQDVSAQWQADDQLWLTTYASCVQQELEERAVMILYGSRARGDWTEESDIDILLITNALTEEESEAWHRRGHELSGTTSAVPSILTIDRTEWERMKGWRLWNEIMRDGVVIT